MGERKAGSMLQFLLHDPLGEELLEGAVGGAMAGLSQAGTGQSPEQIALSTGAAIAGGIGLGMAGRRLGAMAGRRVHAEPLKNQESMAAMIARTLGSETTSAGLRDQGAMMKGQIQRELVEQTSARLAREALEDPSRFAQRYGATAEEFQAMAPKVGMGQTAMAVAESVRAMPPEMRKQVADQLLSQYEKIENLVAREAAENIDENIRRTAERLDRHLKDPGSEYTAEDLENIRNMMGGQMPGDALRSLLNPVQPITGEHVGRAIGRMAGDEIGILGGLALGGIAAEQLGIQSPKDKRIAELEAQLAAQG